MRTRRSVARPEDARPDPDDRTESGNTAQGRLLRPGLVGPRGRGDVVGVASGRRLAVRLEGHK